MTMIDRWADVHETAFVVLFLVPMLVVVWLEARGHDRKEREERMRRWP